MRRFLLCGLLGLATAARAQTGTPATTATPAPASNGQTEATEPSSELAAEQRPRVRVGLLPKDRLALGEVLTASVSADAREGDDITVPAQTFGGFELIDKHSRIARAVDGRQSFSFELMLLALEPGEQTLPGIKLRIVTKEGVVASVASEPTKVRVASPVANEPNAKLRPDTKPVAVLQDDYSWLYVGGSLLGTLLVALLTWLITRWWSRRPRAAVPPPPPRPPWDLAVEQLAELSRERRRYLDAGEGGPFVDRVSDVVRQYLGAVHGFLGLDTTSDEMIELLRHHGASTTVLQEIMVYLGRCDLVKFAKVDPDEEEVDLIFAKARDIVHFSVPRTTAVQSTGNSPSGPPNEGRSA